MLKKRTIINQKKENYIKIWLLAIKELKYVKKRGCTSMTIKFQSLLIHHSIQNYFFLRVLETPPKDNKLNPITPIKPVNPVVGPSGCVPSGCVIFPLK